MGRRAQELEVGPAVVASDVEDEIDLEADFDVEDEAHVRKLAAVAAEVQSPPRRRSPEEDANFVSRLLFLWTTSLFSLAARKRRDDGAELEEDDVWELPPGDQTTVVSGKFDRTWTRKLAKLRSARVQGPHGAHRPNDLEHGQHDDLDGESNAGAGESFVALDSRQSRGLLMSSLWAVAGWPIKVAGVLKFFNTTVQFFYPILLNQLLNFIQRLGTPAQDPAWQGYIFAVALGAAMSSKAILENAYFYTIWRAGWQIRSTLTTEVYRKALRLSASARQSMAVGEIVNLMQLDSTKIEGFVTTGLHILWDAFYQIFGYLGLLYYYIGWPAFVGLGVLLVAIPVQAFIFARLLALNKKIVKVTDSRVKLTNEILQGMLGIKMAAWEIKYTDLVNQYRRKEIGMFRSVMYLAAFSSAYMMAMPAFTAVAAISVYAVQVDGAIDAATLFTALNIFSQLRFSIMMLPQALNALAQGQVSFRRISGYLALEEVEAAASHSGHRFHGAEDHDGDEDEAHRSAMEIHDGTFYWKRPDLAAASAAVANDDDPVVRPVLRDINVRVGRGELTAVVGPVGSGKSSLMAAMLGELYCDEGSVETGGSVAYAAQSAWIFNASVRDNILFGEPYDEERYRRVVRVCQLNHDLEVLPDGDQTVIGERGINLSGGQKQRINVARVAYSTHEIVILDDPLSALDPEVARKLFKECILDFLRDRTRVLVTNQLNVLSTCDKVIVLGAAGDEPGRVLEQGRFIDLMRTGLDFAKLMQAYNGSSDDDDEPGHGQRASSSGLESVSSGGPRAGESRGPAESEDLADHKDGGGLKQTRGDDIMQKEERNAGAVSLRQYMRYIRAGGGLCLFSVVITGFVLTQLATVANTLWVSIWSEDNTYEHYSLDFYLAGYALTAVLLAIFTYVRTVLLYYLGLRASRRLHGDLIGSIMHAPMRFFDTTPIGRVINRFSKDLYFIDAQLPMFFQFFLMMAFMVSASFATVGATTPLFFASIPFLLAIYLVVLNRYRPVARDVKRLESISRSPVYAHFSETLGGLSTIRAFDFASRFVRENESKVDHNLKFWYAVKACERWLSVRLELLGASITVVAAALAVYSASQGALSAGLAGLSLTFAMTATSLLNNTVRSFTELETGMNSVERVLHYALEVEQEAPFASEHPPPPSWPTRGEVDISNLRARYRDGTPLVLKGVSLHIPGGSRVGIVGRTGAGKSSFLSALLRLIEPDMDDPDDDGPIFIDDVDVSKIGLHELRSKVSIVPQSPVLFSGTVRSNLDPFGAYSDAQLWDALQKCAMESSIRDMGGLDAPVSEFGDNFSQGERQLLCLVRSVLLQARILLLDEATSSVDFATDAAIQTTIRDSFDQATIITIAHRLATVIENDYILVLGNGEVLEYDDPATLLDDPSSELSGMVAELGSSAASQLRRRARLARARRNPSI